MAKRKIRKKERPAWWRAPPIDQDRLEAIQWIALATMVVDHAGQFLLANATWARGIGRVTFPLFALVLAWRVSDMLRRNPQRSFLPMLGRLLASGIAAEILFRLLTWPSMLNIMFTFMLALILVVLTLPKTQRQPIWSMPGPIRLVLALLLFALASPFVDYKWAGVGLIWCLFVYFHRGSWLALLGVLAALGVLTLNHHVRLAWVAAPLAALLVWIKAPWLGVTRPIRYLFYWIYPAHLLLIWICFALGFRVASPAWIPYRPAPNQPAAIRLSPSATPDVVRQQPTPLAPPGR